MGLFTQATQRSYEPKQTETAAAESELPSPAQGLMLSPELENAVDQLWVRLRRVDSNFNTHQGLVVTHWERGEGASTVTAAIGLRAAQLDPTATFCLVDFDVYTPGLSKMLGLDRAAGVSDILCNQVSTDDLIAPTQLSNLYTLPAGSPELDWGVGQLFRRCRGLCEDLMDRFHYVLFDVPLLRAYPNFSIWANGLADVVHVVQAGHARHQTVSKAIQTLKLMRLNLAAIVLNRREYHLPGWLYSRT